MSTRRHGGRETWHRLLHWDRGATDAERLAARLLPIEGYQAIDPAHPLGGPDGGHDIVCRYRDRPAVVAVYFPNGTQTERVLIRKFESDLAGARAKDVRAMVFFTNQEMMLSTRARLVDLALTQAMTLEVFHLERVAACLDRPAGYGLRLEFLSIEMTMEEQVSYFNHLEQRWSAPGVSSPPRADRPVTTVEVTQPDALSALSVSTTMFSRLIACRGCDEVFRAVRDPLRLYTSGDLMTVSCPRCGKLHKYDGV
jgi:hypothetical protein